MRKRRQWGKGRTERFIFRLSPREREAIERSAKRAGVRPGTWARSAILDVMRRQDEAGQGRPAA